ncbi:MAG: hypothetical protein KDD67_14295 [Ignavibacteriae bacterium]|nr:hypothetical protein [Ignavibacteriota bacterium]
MKQNEYYTDSFKNDRIKNNALLTALDIRKFEIELYWKRATYFWTFTSAALAGYLAILTSKDAYNKPETLLLISSLGIIFSTAWHLVNRGSKYWQNNCEYHVQLLEDDWMGPFYKTIIEAKRNIAIPTRAYPFSVSKVNQLLSFYIVLIFVALFLYTIIDNYTLNCESFNWFPITCTVLTVIAISMFYIFCRYTDDNFTGRIRKLTIKICDQPTQRNISMNQDSADTKTDNK